MFCSVTQGKSYAIGLDKLFDLLLHIFCICVLPTTSRKKLPRYKPSLHWLAESFRYGGGGYWRCLSDLLRRDCVYSRSSNYLLLGFVISTGRVRS